MTISIYILSIALGGLTAEWWRAEIKAWSGGTPGWWSCSSDPSTRDRVTEEWTKTVRPATTNISHELMAHKTSKTVSLFHKFQYFYSYVLQ